MSDYKVGQIIVVKEDFGLCLIGNNKIDYFKGEYLQITRYDINSLYPIHAIRINKETKLFSGVDGSIMPFKPEEIESFITYEAWIALHREEQIKSIMDE